MQNVTTMPSIEFDFTSADGLNIACKRWCGTKAARGVVQLAHGLGEHIGRYAGLINVLVAEGFIVYGNDHRGHGRSVPSDKSRGDFGEGGFNLLVNDMVTLGGIAKRENPDQPLFLLGHSMGSFAAQQYALDHSREIDGLILSGSGVLDGLVRLAQMTEGTNDNLVNAAFEPARTPFDWLSRDSAVVDAFISDPLCFGSLQPAAYISFFSAADRLSDPLSLRNIRHDLPIYLFSGSEDPIGQQLKGISVLIERYRDAGLNNISHHFYIGGRHEMLNEINRDEVILNLLHWLSSVLETRDASNR